MADDITLFYPLTETDEFVVGNISEKLQELIDKYNNLIKEPEFDEKAAKRTITSLIMKTRKKECAYEFSQVMIILLLAIEKRNLLGGEWLDGAHLALYCGNLEVCRELLIDSVEELGTGTVKNSHKDFMGIRKEDKNQNVDDILGMVMEEMDADGWKDEKYLQLLESFVGTLAQWRQLDVPKTHGAGSYKLVYDIIEACYLCKAYHTAIKLAGLLYVSDRTKKYDYLASTMYLMGKVVYELGYMEVAKRCFMFANDDTDGACWKSGDEKYKQLLQQQTRLELTAEVFAVQKMMDKKVADGEKKYYTLEEVKRYRVGELEIPFVDTKKLSKSRKKLGERAIKLYEKSAMDTSKESLDAIEEAFAILTEAPEVYPEAAYLYFKKGNIYLDKGNFETAYDCFKKAYNCKDGKRNGLVLLGLAIVLSQMGRMKESTAYLFRTYILCGKDFVIDKVGEEPWKMVEAYL